MTMKSTIVRLFLALAAVALAPLLANGDMGCTSFLLPEKKEPNETNVFV